MARKRIGELLIEAGVISEQQLAAALAYQQQVGGRLGRILVEKKLVPEDRLVRLLSSQLGIPMGDLPTSAPAPALVGLIPHDAALSYAVFPVGIRRDPKGDVIFLAMADPTNLEAIEKLQLALGMRVMPFIAGEIAIERAIRQWLPSAATPAPAPATAPEAGDEIPLVTGTLSTPAHGVPALGVSVVAFGAPGSLIGDESGEEDGAMPPPVDFDQLTLAGPPLLQPLSTPPEIVEAPALEVVDAPPLEVVDAPPLEVVEAPPLEVVEAPPLEAVEAPPLEVVDAPPLEVVDAPRLELDVASSPAVVEPPVPLPPPAIAAEAAAVDELELVELDVAEPEPEPEPLPALASEPIAAPAERCPDCGAERLAAAKFCPHCGCSFTGAARAKSVVMPAAGAVVLPLFASAPAPIASGASDASRSDDVDVLLGGDERPRAPVIPLPLGIDPSPTDAARVDEPAALAEGAKKPRSLAADWADVAERPITRKEHGSPELATQRGRELFVALAEVVEEPAAPAPEPQVTYEPAAAPEPTDPAPWAAFASVRARAVDPNAAAPPPSPVDVTQKK